MPSSLILHLPGAVHATRPMYVEPSLCHTAEIANGALTGSVMQHNQSHVMHYRFGGCCHWSPIYYGLSAPSSPVTYYIPIHFPERRDLGNQHFAIFCYVVWTAGTPWSVEFADGFSAAFAAIPGWSGDGSGGSGAKKISIFDVDPPSGDEGDGFKCIRLKFTDCYPRNVSAYPVGDTVTPDDQYLVHPHGCSAGQFIAASKDSYIGLLNGIGTGADDIESMERLTRRTFFNQCHPEGSHISENDTAYHNFFTEHEFQAETRDLTNGATDQYCYPCIVVMADGHLAEDCSAEVVFENTGSGETWTYTMQAGDADSTPVFVHPWTTGAVSSVGGTYGLKMRSGSVDSIIVKGYTTWPGGGTPVNLYLLAWALFEGPAY